MKHVPMNDVRRGAHNNATNNKWFFKTYKHLGPKHPLKKKWFVFKNCATKMNYHVEFGFAHWMNIVTRPCYICGSKAPDKGVGVDRFDNNQHYTIANSRPCC